MGLFHRKSADEGEDAARPLVENAAGHVDERVAVARMKTSGDADGLLGVLTSGADERARHDAVWALVDLQDRHTVYALLDISSRRSEPLGLRSDAVGALGKLRDERAVDVLSSLLNRAGEPAPLQAGAALALGRIGEPRAAEALARAWMEAEDERVQEAAGRSFLALGVTRSDYLMGCLEDPSLCAEAAERVARFAGSDVLSLLQARLDAAAAHGDRATAHACRDAIGAIMARAA